MALHFDPDRVAFPGLNAERRRALAIILQAMSEDPLLIDVRHAAYMLATAWHETAKTLRPIAEYGKGRGRKYGQPGRHGGQVAYGRGFVQLTWDTNYAKADDKLNLRGALVRNYDLAMDPEIAYRIMSIGMHEGWFTGKKLRDYIHGERRDYLNARRIINGTDKAALIAGYAGDFEKALRAATIQPRSEPKPTPEEMPAPKPAGFWANREN